MSDLMTAVADIRQHADAYAKAADYYDGEVPELFCSEAIRRTLRDQVNGFDVNLARRAVDAILDRLRILAVTVPGNETLTRRLVDEVWTPNRMDRYSKTVHGSALIHGDAYLIVWPGEDEGSVEMHYNGPGGCRVYYDPENPREKSHAAKMWAVGVGDQQAYRLNLYYPDRIERWTTEPGRKGDTVAEWLPYAPDGEDSEIVNPYGRVPVFHWRTAEPYGRPEHKGAFGAQNAITKLSASLMGTIDFAAFPQRYALVEATSSPSQAQMYDDDESPEGGQSAEAGPGRVLTFPGVASVGEFAPADPDAFLKPLGFYVRAMAASTATPLRFFDPQGQVPSGEALRADEAPLAQRIMDRAEMFTEEWQEALTFAALVAGFAIPVPDIKWRPVQTIDDAQGWATVKAKTDAGVPVRQALTEAGYTSDLVEEWLAGSDAPNLTTQIGHLAEIGKALTALGSAVSLGAVDKAQVDAIVTQVMGDLIREEGQA